MPIQTDLSIFPYFDDYQELKDYYKVLFKPGTPVQVRELNQIQTNIQKQIERLGDNLYKRGTIIDGVDITFHEYFPYVKINDLQGDGAPANVEQYKNYYLRNSANVQAVIVETVTGFESTSPDLNTLYLRYINSGNDSNTGSFSNDQILTVFSANNIIERVNVIDGSSAFSNNDQLVFVSAIAVQNSTGGQTVAFSNGDVITNGVSANATIIGIDTSTNSQVTILNIKPLVADLNTAIANTAKWSFATSDTVANGATTATITEVIGSGAAGVAITGSVGEVDVVSITSKGSGYYIVPHVTISSGAANTVQINNLSLAAQNFLSTVTVANSIFTPVGSGYGVTVGEGVIYQKGYFTRVEKQLVIVDKYSSVPDAVALGFDTSELIINSNIDQSLLDNAAGSPNFTAPGADRLKLTPVGIVVPVSDAQSNPEFLTIVEFSNGLPYKQNIKTKFNIFDDEISRRTFEESGNYVLDRFNLTTRSASTLSADANTFQIVVDPGVAYINGRRVETITNFTGNVNKGKTSLITTNSTISMNYGNYVRVNQLGGVFDFATGDIVKLYDTAKTYLTSDAGATPSAAGAQIGTAKIRSIAHEAGTFGSPEAIFRLYLFDVQIDPGKSFSAVRSVFYDGTNKGISDIVLSVDPTSGANVAQLFDSNLSGMVFYAGATAIKNANNISYVYKNIDQTGRSLGANGSLIFSVGVNEQFPYTGPLSTTQRQSIVVVPLANAVSNTTLSGTITLSGNTATGTSTSFTTEIVVGDYIKIGTLNPSRVTSISNNTLLSLATAPGAASSNTYVFAFPQFVPIDLTRTGRSATVSANTTQIDINIGATLTSSANVAVSYNIRSLDVSPQSKTVQRDQYVRIDTANTAAGSNTGPWCLGVADVFRLKSVLVGSANTANSTTTTDVTNDYYVDINQTDDFYDLAYLYRKQDARSSLSNTSFLFVKFDNFATSGEGLKALPSYPVDDTIALANAASTVHTLEIPEFYGVRGVYRDLRDQFDLRPISVATATANTNPNTAPINPPEANVLARFSSTNKKFPAPDSDVSATIEYYLGRVDRVIVDERGRIAVVEGTPGTNLPPAQPSDSLTINLLSIPPYPSVPISLSSDVIDYADTKVANEKYLNRRLSDYKIEVPQTVDQRLRQQPRGYTMVDIGDLERRISDLEYYVSFTLAEALVKNKTIPSTVDASIDRFKFGFFVDTFDTYSYSDSTNPKYRAKIANGRLGPVDGQFNIAFTPNLANTATADLISGRSLQLGYTENTLFNQLIATTTPTVTVPATPETFNFNGVFVSIVPASFTPQPVQLLGSGIRNVQIIPGVDGSYGSLYDSLESTTTFGGTSQAFLLRATGLRPNTKHRFLFEGTDNSNRCAQVGKTLYPQTDLITDANGTIELQYFYDISYEDPSINIADATSPNSDFSVISRALSSAPGIKAIKLVDAADTSRAEGTIEIRRYMSEPLTTNEPPPLTEPLTNLGVVPAPTSGASGGGGFRRTVGLTNLK